MKKTASVVTLGCRLNQADSALISDRLRKLGFELISPDTSDESPNLIVVNSCSVTATAARKTRQSLSSIRRANPYSFIVLTGCSASVDKEALADCSDFDSLLPNASKRDLASVLKRNFNLPKAHDIRKDHGSEQPDNKVFTESAISYYPFKSRANLKVQEGCENFCTYCIVPYARGPERSRDINETVEDFKQLVDSGFKEIILSGINICAYKCGNTDLAGLLEKLIAVDGDFRIRLSSTEPSPVLPRLFEVMQGAGGKVCKFLHLPIQHGSDAILKAMGRKYLRSEYADYVAQARAMMPNIHIGSDLIVGFPGETDEYFNDSFDFIKSMAFANLHVFPFSTRKGTPAEKMKGRPPVESMTERLARLKILKDELSRRFEDSLIGTTERVICEKKCAPGVWEGWTGNYVKVKVLSKKSIARKLLDVSIVKRNEEGFLEAVTIQM